MTNPGMPAMNRAAQAQRAEVEQIVARVEATMNAAGFRSGQYTVTGVFEIAGALKDVLYGDIFAGGMLVVVAHQPDNDGHDAVRGEHLPALSSPAAPSVAAPGADPAAHLRARVVFVGFPQGLHNAPELLALGPWVHAHPERDAS